MNTYEYSTGLRAFFAVTVTCLLFRNSPACSQTLPMDGVSPEAGHTSKSAEDHKIAPGDVISVQVFGEPDLTVSSIRLTSSGKITMPLVGEIALTGNSSSQAAATIAARFRDGFLVRPNVTVLLGETKRDQFTILGEVVNQGPYFLPRTGKTTLVEAIASAKGFTRSAKESGVLVSRMTANGEKRFTLDVKKDPEAKSFLIQPGDVITVRQSAW